MKITNKSKSFFISLSGGLLIFFLVIINIFNLFYSTKKIDATANAPIINELQIDEDLNKNILYRLNGKWNYLKGTHNKASILSQKGESAPSSISINDDATFYLSIKMSNSQNYALVFKDFASNYRLFVDDQLIYRQNGKEKNNLITIENPEKEHLLIFQVDKENNNKISLPTFFITKTTFGRNFLDFINATKIMLLGIVIFCLIFVAASLVMKRKYILIVSVLFISSILFFYLILQLTGIFNFDYHLFTNINEGIRIVLAIATTSIFYLYYNAKPEDNEEKNNSRRLSFFAYSVYLLLAISVPFVDFLLPLLYLYQLFFLTLLFYNHTKGWNKYCLLGFITLSHAFLINSTGNNQFILGKSGLFDYALIGNFINLLVMVSFVAAGAFYAVQESQQMAQKFNEKNYVLQAQSNEAYFKLKEQNEQLNEAYNKLLSSQENSQNLMLNVSHDLRTPISIIDGYLQVLNDENIPYEQKKHYFSRIDAKLVYLKKFIADLFLVAKMEEGNFNLIFEDVEVVQFTNTIIGDYKIMAEAKGLEYNLDLTDEKLIKKIDMKHFPRIIENVITNAIKYNKEKGSIKIQTSIVKNKEGDFLRVIIEDTGIGIDEKDLPRIFGAYYLEKRKSNQNDASGVGLYITKQLVDRHKGKLWVESKKGIGTKVFFEL